MGTGKKWSKLLKLELKNVHKWSKLSARWLRLSVMVVKIVLKWLNYLSSSNGFPPPRCVEGGTRCFRIRNTPAASCYLSLAEFTFAKTGRFVRHKDLVPHYMVMTSTWDVESKYTSSLVETFDMGRLSKLAPHWGPVHSSFSLVVLGCRCQSRDDLNLSVLDYLSSMG